MTLRDGMQAMVSEFRIAANAATDDIFAGVTYWTDTQLQDILDLKSIPVTVSYAPLSEDSTLYIPMDIPAHYWLDTDTIVIDSESYTYDDRTNRVTSTDTIETVTGIYVNFYDALAEIWERKAAQRETHADFRAGANQVALSQTFEHCRKMAALYRNKRVRGFRR